MSVIFLRADPYWIDMMVPIAASDAANLYWCSDIPAAEIIDAYAPDLHPNQIASLAGAAFSPFVCEECDSAVIVASRTKAQELFSQERRRARRPGRWDRWSRLLCSDCRQARRDREIAPLLREQHSRQRRETELRTMPYQEYLRTPEWAARRKDALRRARFHCQTCAGGGQLHVHHRTYVRRGAEHSSDLIVLCADCHDLFHKHGKLANGGRAFASKVENATRRTPATGEAQP
ncbi:hypothetical protein PZ895_07860 [Mesorhizobium sp. YIM 152430]|uniref:hypothetical protein n=1 Tax=Mesorhizobium sp. YIM 152430 TaxID=3031761 RepID=UPI0023DB029A|nr:hypothetical protein [Mesorhizobium sp. YIM 152430]MDF1599690.1 hypothetical protein [Mesorhizobium sp. YIM 152430]